MGDVFRIYFKDLVHRSWGPERSIERDHVQHIVVLGRGNDVRSGLGSEEVVRRHLRSGG